MHKDVENFFTIMKMKPLRLNEYGCFYSVYVHGLAHWNIKRKHTIGYIRAAPQVGVINGVCEVEPQSDTLCSKRTEDIFANGTGQHREGI